MSPGGKGIIAADSPSAIALPSATAAPYLYVAGNTAALLSATYSDWSVAADRGVAYNSATITGPPNVKNYSAGTVGTSYIAARTWTEEWSYPTAVPAGWSAQDANAVSSFEAGDAGAGSVWRIDSGGTSGFAYAVLPCPALTGVTTWELEVRYQPISSSSLGDRATVRLIDAVRSMSVGIGSSGLITGVTTAVTSLTSSGQSITVPTGTSADYITITMRRVGSMVSVWYAGQCIRVMGYTQWPTTTATSPVIHIGQFVAATPGPTVPEVRIASFKLLIGAVNPSPALYHQTAI